MAPEIKFFDDPKDLQKMNSVLRWLENHSQGDVIKFVGDVLIQQPSAVIDSVNGEPVVILYERYRTRVRLSEKIAQELEESGIVSFSEAKEAVE